MASRKVLILGATGQQGSATISGLLDLPPTTPPIHILALTRDLASPRAKGLVEAHRGSITLVQGDMKDPSYAFASHKDIASVYLFTMPGAEDAVGKSWVDAAVAAGVTQIVLSTVDRGGAEKSWENPTDVRHFFEKHAIELYLRDKAEEVAKKGGILKWTVLRPTAFLDNLKPSMFGKMFAAMWSASPPEKTLQFISTRDLGLFAAKALEDPDGWDRKAIALAGEEMSYTQARETFRRVVGQEMPQAWQILGRGMLWGLPDVGKMFAFFWREGFGADIKELKKIEPELQNFEEWLSESSGWLKQ
jgi:uncharacterized protein YbjT (DUF2867 family)